MFRAFPRPSSGAYICNDQQRCYRHAPTVKPETANAVVSSWRWARKLPKHVEPHINVK